MRSARRAFAERCRRRPPFVYALLDDSLLGPDEFVDEASSLVEAGVELLQFRAKGLGDETALRRIEAVVRVLEPTGVPLIVNDRVDLARMAGAAGVHLGADDLPPTEARALLGPEAIVGVTAHSPAELAAVSPGVADYVGYGAVFPTGTRAHATVCGPEALTAAVAATSLPVVAIGGIAPGNVHRLRSSGVAAVAVASAVSPSRARPGAVQALVEALREW